MSEKNKHNKNNVDSYTNFMNRIREQQQRTEQELLRQRIINNLDLWENSYTKVKNIKLDKDYVNQVIDMAPVHIAYLSTDLDYNIYQAYKTAKSLIMAGVQPSKVCITSLNDAYLSARGFGETAHIKKSIFSKDNELLIIENVREDRPTDIKDNSKTFFQELHSYLLNNPDVSLIMIGDSAKSIEITRSASDTSAYFNKLNLIIDKGKDKDVKVEKVYKKKRFIRW